MYGEADSRIFAISLCGFFDNTTISIQNAAFIFILINEVLWQITYFLTTLGSGQAEREVCVLHGAPCRG